MKTETLIMELPPRKRWLHLDKKAQNENNVETKKIIPGVIRHTSHPEHSIACYIDNIPDSKVNSTTENFVTSKEDKKSLDAIDSSNNDSNFKVSTFKDTSCNDLTDLTDLTNLTDVTDLTDLTNLTDVTGVTGVTDVTDITDLTDLTNLTDVTDVTDITDLTDLPILTDLTVLTDLTGSGGLSSPMMMINTLRPEDIGENTCIANN